MPEDGVRLRPPRNRVERRAVAWWTAQALALLLPPVIVLVVLGILIAPARFWLLLPAVLIAVLGAVYTAVMPQWRYRVHRWEITDDAVYTSAGWLRQEWRIAPMSRIQTVDTVRGPLQQLFDLSSVTVTTASAAGPLNIDGMDREQAAAVVEQLTTATQATPGDAT
ncbi:PH domain-containing protein [Saccharopolyspora karakumensis]|uniref:PH domain-containing protein n=1 Tax=Saccharopolyspora karakumensis TaxID=2530386 RepID=A0A4R5BVL2_9PSEU|nr:PH domain-containing protein [Saccharopolyspora karakumensis]TDD91188.1 PH domain-containing protein [Saccharopolyspora karakumensis]